MSQNYIFVLKYFVYFVSYPSMPFTTIAFNTSVLNSTVKEEAINEAVLSMSRVEKDRILSPYAVYIETPVLVELTKREKA